MEDITIDELGLADFRINEITLGEEYDAINIVSEGAFRLSDGKKFSKTSINIKHWAEFRVYKYIQQTPYDEGETYEIDWADDLETFEFIQELIVKGDSGLVLNGFSKQSGAWLTYEFKHFQYEIQTEDDV